MNKAERNRISQANFQQRRKSEALAHYGGVCQKCGEKNPALLVFVGNRKNAKGQIYNWLRSKKYPKSFRLECLACKAEKNKKTTSIKFKN
jgi:hypothetical protein